MHIAAALFSRLRDAEVVVKLFEDLGPRFKARPGSYTRILRMDPRSGDSAPMALMQLVDRADGAAAPPAGDAESGDKKAAKKKGAARRRSPKKRTVRTAEERAAKKVRAQKKAETKATRKATAPKKKASAKKKSSR